MGGTAVGIREGSDLYSVIVAGLIALARGGDEGLNVAEGVVDDAILTGIEEHAAGSADGGLAIAEDIIGKAETRCEVEVVGVSDLAVAERSDVAVGCASTEDVTVEVIHTDEVCVRVGNAGVIRARGLQADAARRLGHIRRDACGPSGRAYLPALP